MPAGPPAQVPSPAPPAAAAPAPPSSVDQELAGRVDRVEAAAARLDVLQRAITRLELTIGALSEQVEAANTRTNELSGQLEAMAANLASTPGYGAQKSFECRSCGNHGYVASPLMCTSCGDQNWYGWWPPQQ